VLALLVPTKSSMSRLAKRLMRRDSDGGG
jgi:hypothetical protein